MVDLSHFTSLVSPRELEYCRSGNIREVLIFAEDKLASLRILRKLLL